MVWKITVADSEPLTVRGSREFAERVFRKELRNDPTATLEPA